MQIANERRRWLAYQRIVRTAEALRAKVVGYLSLRTIADAARANLSTVKEAMKFSLAQITLQVRQAFIIPENAFNKDIDIFPGQSSSKHEASPMNDEKLPPRQKFQAIKEKCLKFARDLRSADVNSLRDVKTRGEDDHQAELKRYALDYQRKLQRDKASVPLGRSILLSKAEKQHFLERKTAPGRWEETKNKLGKIIKWLKHGGKNALKVTELPQEFANCGSYRHVNEVLGRKTEGMTAMENEDQPKSKKEIDWQAVYEYDEQIKKRHARKFETEPLKRQGTVQDMKERWLARGRGES